MDGYAYAGAFCDGAAGAESCARGGDEAGGGGCEGLFGCASEGSEELGAASLEQDVGGGEGGTGKGKGKSKGKNKGKENVEVDAVLGGGAAAKPDTAHAPASSATDTLEIAQRRDTPRGRTDSQRPRRPLSAGRPSCRVYPLRRPAPSNRRSSLGSMVFAYPRGTRPECEKMGGFVGEECAGGGDVEFGGWEWVGFGEDDSVAYVGDHVVEFGPLFFLFLFGLWALGVRIVLSFVRSFAGSLGKAGWSFCPYLLASFILSPPPPRPFAIALLSFPKFCPAPCVK